MILPRSKPRKPLKGFIRNGVLYRFGEGGPQECLIQWGKCEYASRREAMAERQNWACSICKCNIFGRATFDHQDGRTSGKRDDRILIDGEWHNAALCLRCNGLKGSKRYRWIDGPDGKEYVPVSRR